VHALHCQAWRCSTQVNSGGECGRKKKGGEKKKKKGRGGTKIIWLAWAIVFSTKVFFAVGRRARPEGTEGLTRGGGREEGREGCKHGFPCSHDEEFSAP